MCLPNSLNSQEIFFVLVLFLYKLFTTSTLFTTTGVIVCDLLGVLYHVFFHDADRSKKNGYHDAYCVFFHCRRRHPTSVVVKDDRLDAAHVSCHGGVDACQTRGG